MDPRLLHYYENELGHLKEMGAEFAQQSPKIAARLGISGTEVSDPYVERLIEGAAFLAARVQLKLDSEFPRFTQSLLEIIYPHYLAPTPSMLVAQVNPDRNDPSLATGNRTVPRGTVLNSIVGPDDATACEFRTAHDVTLLPIEVTSASYFSYAPDLPLNTLPIAQRIRGGLRIRLRTTAGLKFPQTRVERLCFYLAGRDDIANKLLEVCLASGLGVLVRPIGGSAQDVTLLPASAIRPIGFTDQEALLPVSVRTFQGYRLLQEYFTFPQRYRFVELGELAPALRRVSGNEVELVVLLGRGDGALEGVVDARYLQLFCTPAVNLFEKARIDRIHVNDSTFEFHVVADRTRPLDFEIYQVTDVTGHGAGDDSEQRFLPFYAADSTSVEHHQQAYFTTRREPRVIPPDQRRRGPRSSYIGSEVFLSLVDAAQAPYSADLRQLSIQALCTNRDLPLHMPLNLGQSDFTLGIAAPVTSVRAIAGPSRPYSALADRAIAWRAISHLSLNYLSLTQSTPESGASALRDLLELYAPSSDVSARRQIEGIRSVRVGRVVRRLDGAGPLAFGRGLEIALLVDEMAFEGASAFLLGAVLDRYFARHVSINSFTETVLRSENRGEINRWGSQWGARATL
ncbi:MAG TPA: type VI secretion system baseplate subunit TssF [Vicinamibacterales bacterium]|nr:type VI secretion system baseplate subunit TssF [Vicinamibacterales bacterium]